MQRAAFMRGIDHMVIKETEIPRVGENDVLVEVGYVGICGSDVHYYHDGNCGTYQVDLEHDYMLGHECAGRVVQVGGHVKHLAVGDRVALEPGIPCGKCESCREGKYNLCKDIRFLATPPIPGCNEEYIAYPADMCFKLPENVDDMAGALIEPLAVGFHAADQGEVSPGDTVVILGAGCIGLMTMLCCRARGAGKIIIADVVDARLKKALELGATRAVNSRKEDVAWVVGQITGGRGADKVFETAGNPMTTGQTVAVVKQGGRIILVGLAAVDKIGFDFGRLICKEAEIRTVFRYRNIYPRVIEAVAAGLIDVKKVVTHQYELEDIQEAYREAVNNKTDLVKAVIKIHE